MEKRLRFKKGLSAIVTTLIIIALSLVAVVSVWGFVSNFVNKQIEGSTSCFGNYDKITINRRYTCYEKINENEYNVIFSLNIGDIDVESITVSIISGKENKVYEITDFSQSIEGLTMYPSEETQIILPEKKASRSYKATGFTGEIKRMQIAPTINGNFCDISDTIESFGDCSFL
jgi:hypothetical protein